MMNPVEETPSGRCKNCKQETVGDCVMEVQGIHARAPFGSVVFSGVFCSPSCLKTYIDGVAERAEKYYTHA